MTPEQAARRWREAKIARQRRDVELETFPTTAGSRSKNAHPMFGQRQPLPTKVRVPGLVTEPPAPAGMTSWGTWSPAAIEHVGGGYHLVAVNLISQDAGWYDLDPDDEFYSRWSIAVWLIRPDGTISDPWVSDGNTVRTYTANWTGPTRYAYNAPPLGEPTEVSTPKLTRWQEGALIHFTFFCDERRWVNDLDDFWPQSTGDVFTIGSDDVPYIGNCYRWIGHDGTDPVIGPPFELYGGGDDAFASSGDWDAGGGDTQFDDSTIEGWAIAHPSADSNIAVYGLTDNASQHRIWLLDKDPSDNSITLAQRTTIGNEGRPSVDRIANPGGLTRIAADRWIAYGSLRANYGSGLEATLFNAKTGTIIDRVQFDRDGDYTDCYQAVGTYVYWAGNHLHFNGTDTFVAWWARIGDFPGEALAHRHTTLTVDGDTITADEPVEWARESPASFVFQAASFASDRFVETCQGCLRVVTTWQNRRQMLFEGGRAKAGLTDLPTPEFEPSNGVYFDQRAVPSSHPAGLMWASNVAIGDTWDEFSPIIPKLIRYPA